MNQEAFEMFEKMVNDKFTRIERRLDELCNGLDKKYASKITEKILFGAAGSILLYFLGGLLGLFSLPVIRTALTLILNCLA